MIDTKIIEDRRVQEVRITLADGRSGVFTGPELAREEDDGFGVVEIMFYPARPLPEGMKWAPLDEGEAKT